MSVLLYRSHQWHRFWSMGGSVQLDHAWTCPCCIYLLEGGAADAEDQCRGQRVTNREGLCDGQQELRNLAARSCLPSSARRAAAHPRLGRQLLALVLAVKPFALTPRTLPPLPPLPPPLPPPL
eukprot:CAMPEP_0174734790 /NCGR_PEP_ID=MMETSP1094-20130205/63920_1 /TAXON_ID=156173 /ORGANISM="Chrysochromulina brevifilum, Strain UTEX LB 985" /LENGTH=122 /DNA_ID=CAMNT_0015937665 /DNA_START=153 /DNA_END=518 /DNA_ORIENTATION=+